MHVIGMGMRVNERIDAAYFRIQELLSEIRRGIDQNGRAVLLDQDRSPAASVARIIGVAGAPIATNSRHAPGWSAAENGHFHETIAAGRFALLKRRKKFSLVARPSSSTETPLSSATFAAVWTMKAGSLVLPRKGIGAR